ncbi:MAG: hypothetical protein A2283_06910 [Lentisphaerae bacterium RIFOXYA12_FULL_48_11]|nr:MAG: hypothetical protein A2283_06910 [Lentisphaerae bacterium RIFOXYA12_FULL_48_11]
MKARRILLIAGWAHTAENLSPLCSLLSGKYDVQVTSTAKLLCASDPSLQTLPPASQYAKALYGLIGKTTNEAPVIVAWSMGALVAIEAIARLGLAASQLIIINGTAKFCADKDYTYGVPEQNIRAMIASLARKPEELLTTFFRDAMFPETGRSQEIERKTRAALSIPLETLKDGLSYLLRTDLRQILPEISVPTLIIHGRQDKIIPFAAGEFLKKNIPGSQMVIHDNTGHSLILDQPAMIVEDIHTYMEK